MVFGTVACRTVTKTVKVEAFKRCSNAARIEGTCTLTGICIKQSLYVASVSSLTWREAVLFTEGFNESFRAFILQ